MKMEPDREIESSETEMETNKETFERDTSAVPEDRLVKKRNAKAAVWRYFGLETELGMVKNPDLLVCRVCHVRVKNKACQYQQLDFHFFVRCVFAFVLFCFFVFFVLFFFCSFFGLQI